MVFLCSNTKNHIYYKVGDQMLTERRMQKIIDQLVKSIKIDIDILDSHSMIVASSDKSRVGEIGPNVKNFTEDEDTVFIDNNRTYMKFTVGKNLAYFLSVEGSNRVAHNYCTLIASLLDVYLRSNIKKLDKQEVMRRILLSQLRDLDLHELVRDYKLDLGMPRCVFLIKASGMEADSIYQTLLSVFPKSEGDILVQIDGMTVCLVKSITEDLDSEELGQMAAAMEETIMDEGLHKVYIGIGNIKNNLLKLGESYNEAENAIEVGRLFSVNNRIYQYDSLLLERFLHQIPLDLCERYSKALFTKEYKKLLSDEMILTIDKFFENSLNLSETARQLFIHRNTLVYRLDKVQKIMGLDLRNFHDAVTFKIMIMLMDRYMQEC